ncbi:MFS transporter [Clavibacter michiganensis]|uniref:MFS transporter n=1 Tax=Clavibacter michiganensis TaxID=28447 RepID=UPI001365BD85|nr:MFS transporter [Clavibacter michiganensis]MDO4042203.1 MFS transporter [Clavibacter michiganensis]MDO4059817.1 MFS transporter [Clavibacter michiganensis]MDO4076713.1 MFS transporter [Clavibacter michiganensis]MDO4094573.1 MFS transporter [Clavibacter michiganensis]MDO4103540.1 MFS transporter [Clavibacter michiganensis]
MSTPDAPFSLRAVALPALLPALLFSIGEGAIIPIIPIVAGSLGASLAIAAFIGGMIMLGELVGDIPSGSVVSRIGERTAMIGAAFVSIGGLVLCLLAPNPLVLGIGVFLIGVSTAVFALARHAFMTSFVPQAYRARALSTLGGTFRAGYFVGPFLAAGVIHLTGASQSAFVIHIVACLAAAVTLLVLPDPMDVVRRNRTADLRSAAPATAGEPQDDESVAATAGAAPPARESAGLARTLWRFKGVLVKLGSGAALIGAMRAGRGVLLPLWAVSIGISDANTALLIGIAGGVDFALFYASGQIMDRFGRLWSAVPSMVGLGLGYLVLAFTPDLPTSVQWFIGVAMFMSVANGVGSGILMTLGADLAPREDPAPFLGAWRFTGDAGSAASPLLIAALTSAASLAVASGVMGVLGLIGAGILVRYVLRYVPRKPRPTA